MITFSIGAVPCGAYIEDGGYTVSSSLVKDTANSFTDINGNDRTPVLGRKVKLSVRLTDVPKSIAAEIEGQLTAGDVLLTYSAPSVTADSFRCTSYSAPCSDSDPDNEGDDSSLWDISASFESVGLITADDGEGL